MPEAQSSEAEPEKEGSATEAVEAGDETNESEMTGVVEGGEEEGEGEGEGGQEGGKEEGERKKPVDETGEQAQSRSHMLQQYFTAS